MRNVHLQMFVMLSMAVGSGCGGSSSPDNHDMGTSSDQNQPSGVHNFNQIVDQVFSKNCALSGCHAADSKQEGLDLETDPFTALVNAPAQQPKASSQHLARVKPCDPENSFLQIKLTLTDSSFGSKMPPSPGRLTSEQIQAISDWIARGALQDEPDTVTGRTCMVDAGH